MSSLLAQTLSEIQLADQQCRADAVAHIHDLTMPDWALGRLLDLAVDLAGMTRDLRIPVSRKEIVLMAGDHGIVAEGVCPQPSCVTAQMVRNFCNGGGGIGVLSDLAHAHVTLVDIGVASDLEALPIEHCKIAYGTNNFARGPAMSREQAIASLETGIRLTQRLADDGVQVFATGEMGIGNTSPATAILTVLLGETDPAPYVGPGAGLPLDRLAHKAEVIRHGIALNCPNPHAPLDVLAKVGGFEIGGLAGVILAAASRHKPVLVDGFISTAAALLAASLSPASKDYMILAHGSAEPAHAKMAAFLGKRPLLDLNLRLGEGTGAALAMPLLDAASAIMNRMSTFSQANVTTEGIR
ncbi:MAG: nicotinate-nucleotide--dimethylbenzimidazole phosphoribosyltransferase [Victivallales bacterium]|nr:nicotinate-nucleotide--dimethylbenzimidazole phosphoribosyltransferase [Victivallales bacterium]